MTTISELAKLAALGGLQASYVADTAGADNHLRGLRALTDAGEEGGVIDDYYANMANARKIYNKRKRHGAANFAENRAARLLNVFDPTQLITDNPDATLTGALMITGAGDPEKRKRVLEKYRDVIRKYQAKLDPDGPITNRQTSYHRMLQAQLADLDTDIAGHKQQRKENSLNYWLNPFNRAGPTRELGNRMARRHVAGTAAPDSRVGRAFRALSNAPTAGLYNVIAGGEKAQQKLRRAAVQNAIYGEESRPEEKEKKAGLFYRDLDEPRSVKSVGMEVKKTGTGDLFDQSNQTGKSQITQLDVARLRDPRLLTRIFNLNSNPEIAYRNLIESLDEQRKEEPNVLNATPEGRAFMAAEALKRLSSTFGDVPEDFQPTKGDLFDLYNYDKKKNYEAAPGNVPFPRVGAISTEYKDEEEMKRASDCHCYPGGPANPDGKGCNDPDCDHCDKSTSDVRELAKKAAQRGLWDNVHAKRKRGEKPAKKGDKDYPDEKSWEKTTKEAMDPAYLALLLRGAVRVNKLSRVRSKLKSDRNTGHGHLVLEKIAKSPAWQRKAGKNSEGGLNAKGRASYNKATGGNLKAPVTSKNPKGKAKGRKASFCARMSGMKKKNTSKATANDPDSRINKSLRKWNC